MDTKQSLANVITEAVEACYPGVDGLPDASAIADMLEIPPQKEMGDYAFPCFKLSRALHMATDRRKSGGSHFRRAPVRSRAAGRLPEFFPQPG